MRFLVAWDGSELSTLALRATIHVLSRDSDELVIYHVANPGRYQATDGFEEGLQQRLATELASVHHLRILVQLNGVLEEEAPSPSSEAQARRLLTVHEKSAGEDVKISQRIIDFAAAVEADVLVMGSTGTKESASATFKKLGLGSSAHHAALFAPCSVVLIRSGCRVDPKLATVFMVAVDGSQHALFALRLCAEWARPEKDEIVCRVFGPPDFTEPVEQLCTEQLQALMHTKRVEYAVIPTELDDSADVHGDDLAETALQCRFRQQAFLVFGARGRAAEGVECSLSPVHRRDGSPAETSLGHVARWCIQEAQCSLIIARPPPAFAESVESPTFGELGS